MKKFLIIIIFFGIYFNVIYDNSSIYANNINNTDININNNNEDDINNIVDNIAINLDDNIKSNYVILMDYDTGEILYQKNMNEISAPSSMTKIMTAYVIFNMLENKKININDKFKVSVRAWRQEGSRMFLEPEWKINVDELLKGLLIVSGNDAAVTLAEGSCGTIANFVTVMNETAKLLGMENTNFTNPNGLFDKNHYMSVHDLAILSRALIKNHYKYYKKYFSQKNYNFNNISQKNRNWLLTEYKGTDGIKTGYTEQGKYSIAASVERNNKRFIAVINGAENERDRTNQVKTLFNYAYSKYQYIELFRKNQIVDDVKVYFGINNKVSVYTKTDIFYATNKNRINNIKIQLLYNKYIFAPIKKDDKIAKIQITDGDLVKEYDLYSRENVELTTRFMKFKILFKYYAKKVMFF